ncbi:MAG: TonB-dependent receptor domain-containing protein [Acidobacteriota bacterium]
MDRRWWASVLPVVMVMGQLALGAVGGGPDLRGRVVGRVVDETGHGLRGVSIILEEYGSGRAIGEVVTNESGHWELSGVLAGRYLIRARGDGFARLSREIELKGGEDLGLDLTMSLEKITEEVIIAATTISGFAEGVPRIPGSVQVIDLPMLEQSRVLTVNEALRKVPGVHTRDEEGLGLRPNIGMRGVNPTRSTKVLLLEDGIPLAYAPYGDNASYYHPPIERFESIEVLKGSGQIAYGPSTIGGVINYLTPNAPARTTGTVTLIGGNRRFFNGGASFGGSWKQTGLIAHYLRKQSDGARENTHADLHDIQTKLHQTLTDRQALTVKTSYYGETSNLTYAGLTAEEYRRDPRWNPFRNDFFYVDRWGSSVSHAYVRNSNLVVTTNLYAMRFDRDWWRQSSNSLQRPNDAADPKCGGMANLLTTCGNEGRVRSYDNWGLESRLRANFRLLGFSHELDFGGRFHNEDQKRLQLNGESPQARTGLLVENNLRHNQALSSFVQNRVRIGRLLITPGLRVERISFERINRLARNGLGVAGRIERTQVIPGLGLAFEVGRGTVLYGGAHRGFAPPRTEDIINNATGGAIDLDPELSWNYEAGVRHQLGQLWRFEASVFRMDYANQVIPASLAGGLGATLTNGGATRQEGFEVSSRFDTGGRLGRFGDIFANVALTWLPVAEFRGARFSSIGGFGNVRVTGNRLPYAPESLLNASIGYRHPRGLTAMIEGVQTGAQFGDDLNLREGSANGLLGRIPGNTVWNTTVNYEVESLRSTFFVSVKNLFDRVFVVDRTRGLIPGIPRMLQAGVKIEIR